MEKLYHVGFLEEYQSKTDSEIPQGFLYAITEDPEEALGQVTRIANKHVIEPINLGGIMNYVGEGILLNRTSKKNIESAINSLFEPSEYSLYGMYFIDSNYNSIGTFDEAENQLYFTVARTEDEALGVFLFSFPDPVMKKQGDLSKTVSTFHKVKLAEIPQFPQIKRRVLANTIKEYWD